MKTLEEWNRERSLEIRRESDYPRPNGLACPKCGKELQDSDPTILMSYPPMVNVDCPECGYKSLRIK